MISPLCDLGRKMQLGYPHQRNRLWVDNAVYTALYRTLPR
jgi:hypothetical protein